MARGFGISVLMLGCLAFVFALVADTRAVATADTQWTIPSAQSLGGCCDRDKDKGKGGGERVNLCDRDKGKGGCERANLCDRDKGKGGCGHADTVLLGRGCGRDRDKDKDCDKKR